MTTIDVLNTLMFQVDGHGCLGGEYIDIPKLSNCQKSRGGTEPQTLRK